MSKFAYTTYEKTLADLLCRLRGNEFNHPTFISKIRGINEIIVDFCINIKRFEKQYNKKIEV